MAFKAGVRAVWCGALGGRGYFMPESWAKLWTVALVPQDEEECAEERREAEKRRASAGGRVHGVSADLEPARCGGSWAGGQDGQRREGGLQGCVLRASAPSHVPALGGGWGDFEEGPARKDMLPVVTLTATESWIRVGETGGRKPVRRRREQGR